MKFASRFNIYVLMGELW